MRNSMMGMAEYVGMNVSDAYKQKLAEFATFRAKTIANFNLRPKEASGAAVTEQELKRMMFGKSRRQKATVSAGRIRHPSLWPVNNSRTYRKSCQLP